MAAVARITGHSSGQLSGEMYLDSDLGIDSIKMVELLNSLVEEIPAERQAQLDRVGLVQKLGELRTLDDLIETFRDLYEGERPRSPLHLVPDVAPQATPRVDARARVIEAIALVTQYPAGEITDDLSLEADLGVDSIKRVEVLNAVAAGLPESAREELARGSIEGLLQCDLVSELVAAVSAAGGFASPVEPEQEQVEDELSAEPEQLELVLADAQYTFLISYLAGVCSCGLLSRARLRGPFSPALATAAWNDLLDRHPVLRAHFSVPRGQTAFDGYKLVWVRDREAPPVPVVDLRERSSAEQSELLERKISEGLDRRWALDAWPLHGFEAYRLADDEYELHLSNHHLISDGIGNQVILREFLEAYEARAAGKWVARAARTRPEEYNAVVEAFNGWVDAGENEALDGYIRRQGRDKFTFNPHRRARPEGAVPTKTLLRRLSPEQTAALNAAVRTYRVSMNSLLVAAYLRTLSALDPSSGDVVLQLPTGGRTLPGGDVSNILGCFAQNLALSFVRPASNEAWPDLVRRVDATISEGISRGFDRAQVRRSAAAARAQRALTDGQLSPLGVTLVRASVKSNIFLPFIGQTHIQRAYGPLRVVDYFAATGTNPATIDNVMEVFDGALQMSSNYDSVFFTRSDVEAVQRCFVQQLLELAAHAEQEPADTIARTAVAQEPAPRESAALERIRESVRGVRQPPVATHDVHADLEADLGLDSLERIRIINAIGSRHDGKSRQRLLACRTIAELAQLLDALEGRAAPAPRVLDEREVETPLGAFVRQAQLAPDRPAVISAEGETSYRQLDQDSNRIARALLRRGIERGDLVGVMTSPGPMMLAAMLGVMKAGAAYVPLDAEHPTARLLGIAQQARLSIVIAEAELARKHLTQAALKTVLLVDAAATQLDAGGAEVLQRSEWSGEPATAPNVTVTGADRMTVLFTSGSTGQPKGAILNHAGYQNRLVWMQSAFPLSPGDRVAQKTSCGFDISVWELFWPLMYGATVCPAAKSIVRDPWRMAEWMREQRIQVLHFVPSHFIQFVDSLTDGAEFPDLRWLIFSGEALPAPVVGRWIDRFGLRVGLANLYGPTEASIDVTSYLIERRPEADERIPIGYAIDNAHLIVLDENKQPCAVGQMGELWIGGIAIARGYLHNPEATAKAFHPNPFERIPGDLLYRTGDLVTQSADGCLHYHGRTDSQVKIRGFRVELGEVEAVLGAHPAVNEAAVLVVDGAEDQRHLVAFVAGTAIDVSELRQFARTRLPDYMVPHRIELRASLPKNSNGKLDRKKLVAGNEPPAPATAKAAEPGTELILAPAQRWILEYFEAPHAWFGFTRFRYLQPLDISLFERAVAELVEVSAALRASVQLRRGRHVQVIAERVPTPLVVIDATRFTDAERDVEVTRQIRLACESIRIDEAPLFRVILLALADGSSEIAVVGHHLISDLLSNQVLIEQTWRRYARLLAGPGEPAVRETRPGASYLDYMQLLSEVESSGKLVEHAAYWRSQLAAVPPFTVPEDAPNGINDEASAVSELFELDEARTRALMGAAKSLYRSSFYHLVAAPVYRALGEWAERDQVVLSHRSHGRDLGGGHTFFEAAGNFAVNFPVAVDCSKAGDWQQLVQQIAASFEALPMKGVTYDLVGEHLPEGAYPDALWTNVRLNYLGNRTLAPSRLFSSRSEDRDQRYAAPQQKRTALIEILLAVTNGCFKIEVSYSKNVHRRETIRALLDRIVAHLGELTTADGSRRPFHARPSRTMRRALPPTAPAVPSGGSTRREPLSGKVAIVTGGARGIGKATALSLAQRGVSVVVASRNHEQLVQCVQEIERAGGQALGIQTDVSKQADVERLFERTHMRFGRLDILVNNAGVTGIAALVDSDPEEWRKITEVNLFGSYYCSRAALPLLLEAGAGKIINVGSDSSVIGYPMLSAYAASKHAVIGLTKALAEEVKQQNIQVNAVCPSFVDTDMAPRSFRSQALPPERVAEVIAFLASPQSDGITGEMLRVYGTQDMHWYGSRKMAVLKSAALAR